MSATYAEARLAAAQLLTSTLGLDAGQAGREIDHLMHAASPAGGAGTMEPERHLGVGYAARLEALVARRAGGTPLALVLGHQDFHGINLLCTQDALVPRMETEILVTAALDLLPAGRPAVVADLGTGTGAIACAIARVRDSAHVYAHERDPAALALARRNIDRLGLAGRVTLVDGDWHQASARSCDLVVTNPPYVPSGFCRRQREAGIELGPPLALDGGPDGLVVPRDALAAATRTVRPGGHVLIEHGIGQHHALADAARAAGLADISAHRDLANIKRVLQGRAPLDDDAGTP